MAVTEVVLTGWSRLGIHRRAGRLVLVTLVFGLSLAAMGSAWGYVPDGSGVESHRTINLVVSNGHYCRQAPCIPFVDSGYARLPTGPVPGSDNPRALVAVSPGETVTWTYRDTGFCDPATQRPTQRYMDCKGHEIRFENGTPQGTAPIGFLAARSGPVTISWTVPAGARRGSFIRYFCGVRSNGDGEYPAGTDVVTAHYPYGMTGIFKVV
jgi:hypothetical protein